MRPKKHLTFANLRQLLLESFRRQLEFRQKAKVNHPLEDALMSGFAGMYFQDPSLLEF